MTNPIPLSDLLDTYRFKKADLPSHVCDARIEENLCARAQMSNRIAELESQMQGLSNEINDFQNTIERQKLCIARLVDESLIADQAKRLALELECLLNDTQDTAKLSKWWDSAMEALQLYRDACSVAYSENQT